MEELNKGIVYVYTELDDIFDKLSNIEEEEKNKILSKLEKNEENIVLFSLDNNLTLCICKSSEGELVLLSSNYFKSLILVLSKVLEKSYEEIYEVFKEVEG